MQFLLIDGERIRADAIESYKQVEPHEAEACHVSPESTRITTKSGALHYVSCTPGEVEAALDSRGACVTLVLPTNAATDAAAPPHTQQQPPRQPEAP